MARRSDAREIVLQALYQHDVNRGENTQRLSNDIWQQLHQKAKEEDISAFGCALFEGVCRKWDEIDARLTGLATNWTLHRMAVIDRNVLRLAAYELLYTDTPHQIVINEAVTLAKRFGDVKSSSYVNGILDRIVHADTAGDDEPDKESVPDNG